MAFGGRLGPHVTNYEVVEMVIKTTLLKTHARILIIEGILAKKPIKTVFFVSVDTTFCEIPKTGSETGNRSPI
jgi:hypothetical protein